MSSAPKSGDEEGQKRHRPPKKASVVRVLRALKRRYHARERGNQKDHKTNERMMARWTRNVGLFTLALVFIGIITAVIFKRQLDTMQGQLNAMEADQRPWIATTIEIASDLVIGDSEARIRFKYTLENTGKSPAFNVIPIPTMLAQITGRDFLLNPITSGGFLILPLNPIKEVKSACDRYAELKSFINEGYSALFGNTIFPGKSFPKEEWASIGFPSGHQTNPIGPLITLAMPPRQQTGSVYVVSCVTYLGSDHTAAFQTGDVFFLRQIDEADATKTVDVNLLTERIITKAMLRLEPHALGAYAK
jgi:hypothetical protein